MVARPVPKTGNTDGPSGNGGGAKNPAATTAAAAKATATVVAAAAEAAAVAATTPTAAHPQPAALPPITGPPAAPLHLTTLQRPLPRPAPTTTSLHGPCSAGPARKNTSSTASGPARPEHRRQLPEDPPELPQVVGSRLFAPARQHAPSPGQRRSAQGSTGDGHEEAGKIMTTLPAPAAPRHLRSPSSALGLSTYPTQALRH